MKCHYEVLGLPLNASVEDIKKSYRRLALEWHPDKNLHRTEEATEIFQLIQQAYEVLVDPQERAWYDRNRDKILRGDEDYVDDHLDVYQYFNTSRFKGYGDDEKSFYTIYREVFEKIAAEDKPFMDEDITVPSFGYSYSPYKEEVFPFYAYWQSYCTAKSYTWVDKYDLVEARKCGVGRQVIRCMERENKKLREQHKKTRNEEIRQLVAFVRKRDKRIEDYRKHLEQQNAEKAKKAQERRRKQIAERKKHLENYKETEWTSMSALESHLNEIEANLDYEFGAESSSDKGDEDSTSDVADVDVASDLYCVACDKAFRSAKAMTNHENSKKHKENVASLKEFMQDEVEDVSDPDENLVNGDNILDGLLKTNEEQDICEPKQSASKRKKKKKKKKLKEQLTDDASLSDLTEVKVEMVCHEVLDASDSEATAVKTDQCDHNSDSLENGNLESARGSQKQINKAAPLKLRTLKQGHKQTGSIIEGNVGEPHFETESTKDSTEDSLSSLHRIKSCKGEVMIEEEQERKKSRSAQRKAKKKVSLNTDEQTDQVATMCVKCGKVFGSRNKLFDHLKDTGHSAFLLDKGQDTLKLKKKRGT